MEASTRLFPFNWLSILSGAKSQRVIRGSFWTSRFPQRLLEVVQPAPGAVIRQNPPITPRAVIDQKPDLNLKSGCTTASLRAWTRFSRSHRVTSPVECQSEGHALFRRGDPCGSTGQQRDQLSTRGCNNILEIKKHTLDSQAQAVLWSSRLPQPLHPQTPSLLSKPAAPSTDSSRALHSSALLGSAPCPAPQVWGRRPVVAVGMSGGVDSTVSALLLQRAGYDVVGLFMRNWDAQEEDDAGQCSADEDLKDAKMACKHLGIPLQEVDFVRRYWTDVFEHFVAECALGLTPNPDLPCNRHIKFDALLHHALDQGADMLATGHYARLDAPGEDGAARLLRARDLSKDQSYFLAQVPGSALTRVLFPVGGYLKPDVRQLAGEAGLLNAQKRSSRGICFVGKRRFEDFIAQYVPLRTGPFVNVEDGRTVGTHRGLAAYTNGQRARIGGSPVPWFVVGKASDENAVLVALGEDHPALFTSTALVAPLFWVAGQPPREVEDGREMECSFKARYVQMTGKCSVKLVESRGEATHDGGLPDCGGFERSVFSRVAIPELMQRGGGQTLHVRYEKPERALTPRQALVLYDGDLCLGGGLLAHPGRTEYELHQSSTITPVTRQSKQRLDLAMSAGS